MSKLIVFTGAGISADSGIPTFRDNNGLWENYNPETIANYRNWKQNRALVYRFYNERRAALAGVEPNPAHHMVADWQKRFDATVITQNIDDLFERAGCTNVLHVHGDIKRMQCTASGCPTWDIGYADWGLDDQCPGCGTKKGVKPAVVFFHEDAPLYATMWKELSGLTKDDLLVVIGTSGLVIDIGSIAAQIPATTVLSNLESQTATIDDSQFDHVMHGSAATLAPDLDKLVSSLIS